MISTVPDDGTRKRKKKGAYPIRIDAGGDNNVGLRPLGDSRNARDETAKTHSGKVDDRIHLVIQERLATTEKWVIKAAASSSARGSASSVVSTPVSTETSI
jgi:hypothetical protein